VEDQSGLVDITKWVIGIAGTIGLGSIVVRLIDYFSGRRRSNAEAEEIELSSERLTRQEVRDMMEALLKSNQAIIVRDVRNARLESVLEDIQPHLDKLPLPVAARVMRVLEDRLK